MTCVASTTTLLNCIQAVCRAADGVVTLIAAVRQSIAELMARISQSQATISCVLDGPVGGTCTTPGGLVLPTLAEKLTALNAAAVSEIVPESAIASAGQTELVLSAAADFVAVALNGAVLTLYVDYAVSGDTVTFSEPLEAGDEIAVWRFVL